MGNEGQGLAESTINATDYVAKIPMMNGVDSLNVAARSRTSECRELNPTPKSVIIVIILQQKDRQAASYIPS